VHLDSFIDIIILFIPQVLVVKMPGVKNKKKKRKVKSWNGQRSESSCMAKVYENRAELNR